MALFLAIFLHVYFVFFYVCVLGYFCIGFSLFLLFAFVLARFLLVCWIFAINSHIYLAIQALWELRLNGIPLRPSILITFRKVPAYQFYGLIALISFGPTAGHQPLSIYQQIEKLYAFHILYMCKYILRGIEVSHSRHGLYYTMNYFIVLASFYPKAIE